MKHERLTRKAFEQTLGAWNPVGHAVMAFENDETAEKARAALREGGMGDDEILVFTSKELEPRINEMLRATGGGATAGYEINLMRRYLAMAHEGAGWLIVHAGEDGASDRITEVAKRFNAKTAVLYHTLVSEDLV